MAKKTAKKDTETKPESTATEPETAKTNPESTAKETESAVRGGQLSTGNDASQGQLSTGNDGISNQEMAELYDQSLENLDMTSEIQMSRVAILQPLSPEINDEVVGYSKGDLVDSVTREHLSRNLKMPWMRNRLADEDYEAMVATVDETACMLYVPVFKLPTEFIKWIPRDDRQEGDPLWEFKTFDRNDPRVREGVWPTLGGTFGRKPEEKGKSPPVTDNNNYLILPVDPETFEPMSNFIVCSFSRTSANAGKLLNKFYTQHRLKNLAPWGQLYWAWTKRESAAKNLWWEIHTEPGPLFRDACPHLQPMIHDIFKRLSDRENGREIQEAFLNAAEISEEPNSNPEAEEAEDAEFTVDKGGDENPF